MGTMAILITVPAMAVLTFSYGYHGSTCAAALQLHALHAFQVYLRSIARTHVQGEVNAADIEKDVQRKFRIDLTGKLAELQEPMDKSRVCTALDFHVLPCVP